MRNGFVNELSGGALPAVFFGARVRILFVVSGAVLLLLIMTVEDGMDGIDSSFSFCLSLRGFFGGIFLFDLTFGST